MLIIHKLVQKLWQSEFKDYFRPVQYLSIWDLVLTPIYLIVLIAIAKRWRDKHYPHSNPLRKYVMPGLYAKFGGAIFIALVFQFYYGYGDTFNYFAHSQIINSAATESFSDWLKLLVHAPVDQNPTLYKYVSQMYWYNDPASYSVCVIGAVLGIISGTTYLPTALLFAFISYTGIWAMFRTFVNLYPKLHKQLAIAFLFIPSTFVWGSGIFKDTICMFGLGWMTFSVFNIFINRDFSIRNFFFLAFSFYLIAITKIYIVLAFVPAILFWILLMYSHRIRSSVIRLFAQFVFIGIIAGAFLLFSRQFSKELNRYSLDNIYKTAESTRNYIGYVSDKEGGSGYDLGEFDGSLGGMLKKFPAAVVVTLFRPFPWEAGKVIVLLSALEALVLLYFTAKTFFKNGLFNNFRQIARDPNILFCLTFSLIFAFAVGVTSYNFGALSRYKIPCLPFYGAFLVILLYKEEKAAVPTINRKKPVAAPAGT